jgi:hypothetical protein
MKDIFVINESERERILKMHVERTQKHYLKEDYEINENAKETGEYKIQSNEYFLEYSGNAKKEDVKLFKGATFKKTPGQEKLVANTTYQFVHDYSGAVERTIKGTITYLCQSGKFVTDQSNDQYYDEQGELVKRLKLACAFKGQGAPEENKELTQTQQNAIKCGWKTQDGSADIEGYKNSGWKCPISCGWKKQDGTADIEGYKNSGWKCPKPGTQKPGGTTSSKINTPSDADLDNILQQLG